MPVRRCPPCSPTPEKQSFCRDASAQYCPLKPRRRRSRLRVPRGTARDWQEHGPSRQLTGPSCSEQRVEPPFGRWPPQVSGASAHEEGAAAATLTGAADHDADASRAEVARHRHLNPAVRHQM